MATGKHVALATELERNILAGMYGWEGGLPSTGELAQKWNMSINTVKNALSLLEGKNIIEKRGIGYYINLIPTTMTQYVPSVHTRLSNREGFVRNIGPVNKTSLPEHIKGRIHLSGEGLATFRVQVSGEIAEGNEKPLQITYRYYLIPISEDKSRRMQNDATYDPMWNDSDIPTELVSHDEITPRLATEGERDLLSLPESTPITSLFEVIRDKNDKPLTVQEIILSPRTTLIFDFPFVNRPSTE